MAEADPLTTLLCVGVVRADPLSSPEAVGVSQNEAVAGGERVTTGAVAECGALGLSSEAAVAEPWGEVEANMENVEVGAALPLPPALPLCTTETVCVGAGDSEEVRVVKAEAEAQGEMLPVREAELDPEGLTEGSLEKEYVGEVEADPTPVADADWGDEGVAVKSTVFVSEVRVDCVAVAAAVSAGDTDTKEEAVGDPLAREDTEADREAPPEPLNAPVPLDVADRHSDAVAEEDGGAVAELLPVIKAVLVSVAAALREEEGGTEMDIDGADDAELLLEPPPGEVVPAPSPVPLIVRLACADTELELLAAGEEDKDAEGDAVCSAEALRGALTDATVALPVADKESVAVGEVEGEREKEGDPVSVADADAEPSTPDEEGELET